MLSILSAVLLSQIGSPAPSQVIIDGGSMYPRKQIVSYRFTCPDGVVTVDVTQVHGLPPKVTRALYGDAPITAEIGPQISRAISALRTVESVSPRCLTGGGIWLIFGGLLRDENPSRRHVVSVQFGRHGHATFN